MSDRIIVTVTDTATGEVVRETNMAAHDLPANRVEALTLNGSPWTLPDAWSDEGLTVVYAWAD